MKKLFLSSFLFFLMVIFLPSLVEGQPSFRNNKIARVYSVRMDSIGSLREGIIVKLDTPIYYDKDERIYKLFINNIPYGKFVSSTPDLLNQELHFDLTQDIESNKRLMKSLYRFGYPRQEVMISVANSKNEYISLPSTLKSNFILSLYEPFLVNSVWGLIGIVVILFSFVSIRHNMLKDNEGGSKGTYSWSRTQLAWWTLIIFISYIYTASVTKDVNQLNNTVVILLGISAATTLAGRIAGQSHSPAVPPHPAINSRGFLVDILSEYYGGPVSVHRFQSVIFNFALGLMFLYDSLATLELPTYEAEILTLLGISSATYASIKAFENQKPAPSS